MFRPKYSLLDYIDNRRIFVSVGASTEFNNHIVDYLKSNSLYNGLNHSKNIDPDPFYHVTLWYSKTGWVNPISTEIPELELEVENWDLLGKNKEHLTLKLKPNDDLLKIKEDYGRYGLSSDWPTFKPHMTLVYHYNKTKHPRIDPPKTVKLGQLHIEETVNIDGYN